MCGIAGICRLEGSNRIPFDTLVRMTGTLRHRGPDETGIYIDKDVGLGHARLSIIDLASGLQPIHNEDETIWIVYNGEVFNYVELRQELIELGHRFWSVCVGYLGCKRKKHVPCPRPDGDTTASLYQKERDADFLIGDQIDISA